MSASGIQNNLDVLTLQALADFESLAEQMDIAIGRDLSNESDAPGCDGQRIGGYAIGRGQLVQFALSPMLFGGQASQALLDMLGVDGVLQALQFAFQGAQLGVMALEQARLEPAVEMFDTAIALRACRWDQHRLGSEAQAQAQNAGEVTGGGSPADDLTGIIELHLGRDAQGFPALAQEVDNGFHLAGTVDFQAHGAIEDVFASENVVTLPLAFQVDGADAVHLMELIRVVNLRSGISRVR